MVVELALGAIIAAWVLCLLVDNWLTGVEDNKHFMEKQMLLEIIQDWWWLTGIVLIIAGGHFTIIKKLDEIKRETQDNRERSIAAQDVVKNNTEMLGELRIVLTEIKTILELKK